MIVALAGEYHPSLIARLSRRHLLVTLDGAPSAEAARAHALVTRGRLRVDAALLEAMPALGLVVKAGSGLDTIDVASLERRGVALMRTGGSAESVAELAVALLFAALRHVPTLDRAVRGGDWGAKARHTGGLVRGRRLGILGFGDIGRETARLGAALGMEVGVHDRSVATKGAALAAIGARAFESPHALAARSDVLSIHLPSTPGTRGLVDADVLGALPHGAVLVNTARAEIVERAALEAALASGRLAAAALDVHYAEYTSEADPLLSHTGVVATPHVGAQTAEAMRAIADRIVARLDAYEAGLPEDVRCAS